MDKHSEALTGARVLVVEDEYFIADDLASGLREAGATAVGPVATLQQAEAKLAEEPIDAAILDMNLRGEKAFSLAERVARARLPCVIVSGYTAEALPASIAGLPRLEKPVEVERVMASLRAQLARQA